MRNFLTDIDPKPINGGVLVRVLNNKTQQTPGGIYIPDIAKSYPVVGKVKDVSRGYYADGFFKEHEVHIGDTVIFPINSGFDLIIDNVEFRIVHEKEIIAILKGVE